ncbi:hypothetical protein FGB62_165g06 [Gracilaria domingensis]|nr:hypothetical protein FGB62_165g06 [Gracilaria domingensis]
MKEVQRIASLIKTRIHQALDLNSESLTTCQPSTLFNLLLVGEVLKELVRISSNGLKEQQLRPCTEEEMKVAIGIVAACAFYRTSFDDLINVDNKDVYNFGSVNVDRVREIITSIGVKSRDSTEACRSMQGSYDRDINCEEEVFAATCCQFLYVPGMSFSADDDVTRQRSNELGPGTGLRQVNLEKVRGAQQTTLSNPLTNLTLCTRYAVPNETPVITIGTLIRRVQGQSEPTNCMFRNTSTLYIDRGYVSDKVIEFLRSVEMHIVGTQKRGPQAPFTYGDSREFSSTRIIQEFGILSAYWAEMQHNGGKKSYHLALREASTTKGRVALLVTTRADLAGNKWVAMEGSTKEQRELFQDIAISYKQGENVCNAPLQVFGDRLQELFLQSLNIITVAQSSDDKLWFLARGLYFPSTTTLSFLEAAAKYKPDEVLITAEYVFLCDLVGIRVRPSDEATTPLSLISMVQSEKINVTQLKEACRARKIARFSNKGKQDLREMLAAWSESSGDTMEFSERIANLALQSWCFKPRKSSEDMRAGSRNEATIRETLPQFLLTHAGLVTLSARCYGLLQRKSDAFDHMATSPDMIAVLMKNEDTAHNHDTEPQANTSATTVVCEFKTFSGNDSLSMAYDVRDRHGIFCDVTIGVSYGGEEDTVTHSIQDSQKKLFHSVVPWKAYRYQILHHAAVFSSPVLFVAASRTEIVYVARIQCTQPAADSICTLKRNLQHKYIRWSRIPLGPIPEFRKPVYGFGKDNHSVSCYLGLVASFHEMVKKSGPIKAAKYIRPKLVVCWNVHKGGTDVLSRVISNYSFRMSKQSLRGIIIWRLFKSFLLMHTT